MTRRLAPILVIGGPTGSGKSGLAVRLALEFSGEILNCDSLQVYRHFNIGTAKIPISERGGVTHHLIDAVEPGEGFTAGEFARRGRDVLSAITGRENLPIVAGGTGFYLRALLEGLPEAPPRDVNLRRRLALREQKRPGSLHSILQRLDPISGARIHPSDTSKIIRALEIRILSSRNRSGVAPGIKLEGYQTAKLGLFPPRALLYSALNQRSEEMFSEGLIEEVRELLAKGIPRDARPFGSLGYKEVLALVEGRISREEALQQMQQETRQYAKRQMSWFRSEREMEIIEGFGDDPHVVEVARERTRRLLNLQ